MAYQSNNLDITGGLVSKSYLLDIYPSLSNVVASPALWIWGDNIFGNLGDNTITPKSSPVQTITGGTNWKQVCGGNYHTLGIKSDGTLWVWGYNFYGNLGNNTSGSGTNKSSPVQTIAGGTNWQQVAGGWQHTAAIKTDGTLWTWGHNSYGQLGDNTTVHKSSPVQTVAGGTNWRYVACGYYQTLAIKTDGTLWACGYNIWGQLGTNNRTNYLSPVQTVAGGTNWKMVSTQDHITSAIKTDGTLWTWGYNLQGQLGDNTTVHKSSPVQTVAGGTNWKQSVTNSNGSAAIKTDGTLWVWGAATQGALGDGSMVHKSSPVQTAAFGTNWKLIGCSRFNFAAIKSDGTLWTWGTDGYGLLGSNTAFQNRSSPAQTIMGGTSWKYVSGGGRVVCAIADALGDAVNPITSISLSGTQTVTAGSSYVYTAIINYLAGPSSTDCTQLSWVTGDTSATGTSTIIDIAANGVTISMDSEGSNTVIAQDLNSSLSSSLSLTVGLYSGTAWGWGINSYGQLGNLSLTSQSSPVQTVAGGSNWKQISTWYHTAAVKADGTLWAWGRNDYGQLLDNTQINKSSPVQSYGGGTNWKQVSVGGEYTAAIKTDNTLWTWGANTQGQLGDNTTSTRLSPVQTISAGTNWKQVSAGVYHIAAIKTNGTLWLWGYNAFGNLGDNTTANRSSPVQTITGGTNWKQVSCGRFFTSAAIKTDGTLWVWGYSGSGVLGDNTLVDKSSPVQTVAGGTNWKQISVAGNHMTAIKTDGTLWLWGQNYYGQLGDGTTAYKSSPIQTITGGTNWSSVACCGYHTAAIKTDGTLWTWGYDNSGQLGNNIATGFNIGYSSPIQTIAGGTTWKQVACGYYHTVAIKS